MLPRKSFDDGLSKSSKHKQRRKSPKKSRGAKSFGQLSAAKSSQSSLEHHLHGTSFQRSTSLDSFNLVKSSMKAPKSMTPASNATFLGSAGVRTPLARTDNSAHDLMKRSLFSQSLRDLSYDVEEDEPPLLKKSNSFRNLMSRESKVEKPKRTPRAGMKKAQSDRFLMIAKDSDETFHFPPSPSIAT